LYIRVWSFGWCIKMCVCTSVAYLLNLILQLVDICWYAFLAVRFI
jgi:hypothetical protein